MYKCGARTILAMYYTLAVVWLVSSFITSSAYCDSISALNAGSLRQSVNKKISHDIQGMNLQAGSSFYSFRTEIQYSKYLNTPLTPHESFSSKLRENDVPRMDLLAIFRLAMEEFDILSGVRIYWNYTERNIENLAIKLRLKGEISISDPYTYSNGQLQKETTQLQQNTAGKQPHPTGVLSLFTPQTIRWNLGINPNESTVFGDIRVNSYLSLNGEFGDDSQVGLYFRYPF